jgi:hypothetical protein
MITAQISCKCVSNSFNIEYLFAKDSKANIISRCRPKIIEDCRASKDTPVGRINLDLPKPVVKNEKAISRKGRKSNDGPNGMLSL